MCLEMVNVGSERPTLESERRLSDLLVILQVQGVSDVFAYSSLEASENGIISMLEIICGFPSTDHSCYAACYGGWVYGGRLKWLDIVEARFR